MEQIEGIYIPNEDSVCKSWEVYFKDLVGRYGEQNARRAWLYTFNQKGNESCTKDESFNEWAAKNEVGVADGYDKAVAGLTGVGHRVINGLSLVTGLAPKVGTVTVVAVLGLSFYFLYRFVSETQPSQIIQQLPAGKIGSITKMLKK